MATVVNTYTEGSDDGSVIVITWSTLTTTNDNGQPVSMPEFHDKTVSMNGTFGTGGTVKFQGSNDNSNWFDLTDPQGNAISKTAASMEKVAENPLWLRPFVSAGDGSTDLDVVLVARRDNTMRT